MDTHTARPGNGIAFDRDGDAGPIFGTVTAVDFSGIVWTAMTPDGGGYRDSETVITPRADWDRITVIA